MTKRILSLLVVLAMLVSVMPVCAVSAEGSELETVHTHEGWTELGEGAAFPTKPGKYYLSADLELTNYASPAAGEITLCLGGHDLIQKGTTYVLYINSGVRMTLCDCTAKEENGVYTAGALRHAQGVSTDVNGSAAFVCRGGSLTLESGMITGNTTTNAGNGGTVYLQANDASTAGGVFTMTGGAITGNTSTKGGAVHVKGSGNTAYTTTPATFTMTGGVIENNLSTVCGAVCASGTGAPVVNITGGILRNNEAGDAASNAYSDTKGNGAALFVRDDARVTVKNAEISGNTAHNSSGGAIYARDNVVLTLENTAITGNTTLQAGAIYVQNNVSLSLKDVQITGNRSEKAFAGGVYVTSGGNKLTVSGSTVIAHNTCTTNDGRENMQIANASAKPLYVNGLTQGADIRYRTSNTAETDVSRLIAVAEDGKQEDWNAHWITANGQSISRVNGSFVLGHYHGNVKYEAWTGGDAHNTLPTGNGNYYLVNDILRNTNGGTASIAKGTTQHMCLNGNTITHRNPANRLYNIQGTFFLEDCSAYKDGEGNYISGGITYGGTTASTRTYGNCFSVQVGSSMTMEAGQIYGFYSDCKEYEDSVPVYIQGSSANGTSVFTMNGGQIHSNSSKSKGAAIKESVNANGADPDHPVMININGGKIWGNTSTTGGAVAATGDVIHITGGVITDNTVVNGAVQALDKSRIMISGNPTIEGNRGGDLYLAGDIVIELGAMTGGKIGITAAKVGRAVSTPQTADPTAYFESNDSEARLSYKNNCLYLGAAHEHGIDGKAGSMGFSKWTSTNSLPTTSGNYYLENDIQLQAAVSLAADQNINICLNGKTVTARSGARILAVSRGSTVSITDCCETCGVITGGTNNYGAAFNVLQGGTLNLYNGCITGNTSGQEGGAVYIQAAGETVKGGVFNMYGGTISGNTAKLGGAVALAGSAVKKDPATFRFYGGTIENNSATRGGAVFSYTGGSVELCGGRIVNNTATGAGGGLFVPGDMGSVTVSGAPMVKDNKSGTQSDNIHLVGDAVITVGELTDGAQLFVTAEKCDRAVTNQVTEAEAGRFYSDSAYRMIVYKDSRVCFEISDEHVHCTCFYKTEGCDHTEHKWQAWESTTTLPTSSGNYYLLSDVVLADRCTVPKGQDVKLCLNGKTVTAPQNNRLILVQAEGRMSVVDCVGTGILTGGNNTYGGAVNVNRKATFDLYGGTISGNRSQPVDGTGLGGGIYAQSGATVNIYGGTIENNTAYRGGGIYLAEAESEADGARLNIYGGTITANHAGSEILDAEGKTVVKGGNGAAVYAAKHASVTMEGGTISGNKGLAYGGNIYINGAYAKLSGGRIADNTGLKDGGGFYAVNGSKVRITGNAVICNNAVANGAGGGFGAASKAEILMDGGTVSDNFAVQGGGAIIQSGARLTMIGGTFSGNESKAYGGAIYVNQPNADGTLSTMYLQGGTITANKSGNAAGGVYVNRGYMEMTGGTISRNETANFGCGIYYMYATGKVTGGTITQNVSIKDGAGVYAYAGAVEIGGDVKIINNISQKGAGGGIGFTKECKAKLTGGTITGNSAANAGGIIVQGKAHLTMTGGYVAYNTVQGAGGGVYVNKSSMDFYGGTIAYNKSTKTGAGMYANDSTVNLGGTVFANNEAAANGGAFYINKGTANITGGIYRDNSSQRYGGGMYFNTATVSIRNAKVTGNYGKVGSGGMHGFGGDIKMENCLFSENKTDSAGGGICITKFCKLTMSDCIVEKNEANNGGGVLIQNWAEAWLNDVSIRENKTAEGSGLYIFSNVKVSMNGGEVSDNEAYTKLNKAGNTVGGIGAGIYMHTGTKTRSGASTLTIDGTRVSGNKAAVTGGGIYIDKQMTLEATNITVDKNTADQAAGVYTATGTTVSISDSDITANTAKQTGSAIYAQADLILHNVSVTANTTTEGSAVYLAPARFDGQSFLAGIIKFSGDMQITGNTGTMPDLFVDEGTTVSVDAAGFGEKTEIYLQLAKGLLTYTLFGVYDYEGGNGIYTVTCGDRSVTDPEYDAEMAAVGQTGQEQKDVQSAGNMWLYAGVGVFVLAVIAVIVLLTTKKKKTVPEESK